jgi:hypothetical protein
MNHLGFPKLGQLKCPVFDQDKYKYLFFLRGITNETEMIPIGEHVDIFLSLACSLKGKILI